MANLGNKTDKTDTQKPTASLSFTDQAAPPSPATLNKAKNPFAEKVADLATQYGKTAYFTAPNDDVDGLVNQFRAACAMQGPTDPATGKPVGVGSRVRTEPVTDDTTRVYIWCAEKRAHKARK